MKKHNYLVTYQLDVYDQPDPAAAARQARDILRQKPATATTFHVIDRRTGEVTPVTLVDLIPFEQRQSFLKFYDPIFDDTF